MLTLFDKLELQIDLAKKKQLQTARQEAWEREIKMQTQPLKMISLGCVWEGETTAIAARQLEKLLSFKVRNYQSKLNQSASKTRPVNFQDKAINQTMYHEYSWTTMNPHE